MTLGEKIQKLRKENGFSQEVLAEKVDVTRQTISKWELNQSSPDLDFIVQLSEIFNVSSDYLIKDDITEPDQLPHKRIKYCLSEQHKRIILLIVSASALIACCVCLGCDYFISKGLSWSLIATVSILAAWLVVLPSLTAKSKIILKTLFTVSIIPVPLLAVLAVLLKKSIVLTMGTCFSLIAIAIMWAVYGIFLRYKRHLWRALGFALLLFIPAAIAITHIPSYFLPQYRYDVASDVFNSGITLAMALGCFGIDYLFGQRKGDEGKEKWK